MKIIIINVVFFATGLILMTSCNRNIAAVKQYYYDCPIHHDYVVYSPGNCPECGLNLQEWKMEKSNRKSRSHNPTTNKNTGGGCH